MGTKQCSECCETSRVKVKNDRKLITGGRKQTDYYKKNNDHQEQNNLSTNTNTKQYNLNKYEMEEISQSNLSSSEIISIDPNIMQLLNIIGEDIKV